MGSRCARPTAETAHNPSDCEAEAERSKWDGEREQGGRPGDRRARLKLLQNSRIRDRRPEAV